MKVCSISDQGTSVRRQAGLVLGPSIFGVFDGKSRPTPLPVPPIEFGDLSGGEMAVRVAERVSLACSRLVDDPRTVLRSVNNDICAANAANGFSVDDTPNLAGTVFAVASVTRETVQILQTGDCYAVVRLRDGTLHVSENRVRAYSYRVRQCEQGLVRRLAVERGINLVHATADEVHALREGVREELYKHHQHALLAEYVNNPTIGWGLLNGQPGVEEMWGYQTYPRQDVDVIILFNRGFVGEDMIHQCQHQTLGMLVLHHIEAVGLHGMLTETRRKEARPMEFPTGERAEATAIALTF